MNIWIYEAATPQQRLASHKAIGRKLQDLEAGKDYIVQVKVKKNIRSIKQNAFFHAVCQLYAVYTGHTLEEIKDEFKRARWFEMREDKLGRQFKRLKSTAGLDTAEFASVCNNLLQWGREEFPGCIVPEPQDMDYKMWMDIQNDYEAAFKG